MTTTITASSNYLKSIRIVTADHYLHDPINELDPLYSEFRASTINKVPIIRIFGTDVNGTKTCLHVHGVFPYFYIPYDVKDGKEGDQFIYQVATSLDKAINISMGQANASVEHVFKIAHVKGIPFYGFHPVEHQFLKIYLHNPQFIRRAANLFQNGAILGKIFQPHESHLPYVLQFMIDYNLYGMSFLHVPAEVVRYRKLPTEDLEKINQSQLIKHIEPTSVSKVEIDIQASHILNRLELLKTEYNSAKTQHENPGIASIWKDEKIRRDLLNDLSSANGNMPSLEIPLPEYRPNAQPTESHNFYREALVTKLNQDSNNITTSGATTNSGSGGDIFDSTAQTIVMDKEIIKKKFNLKQFLSNSVYPAECSQYMNNILNATNTWNQTTILSNKVQTSSQQLLFNQMNDSVVDENIISSLSQKLSPSLDATLNEAEFELLDIMRKLENNDLENRIDEDSILAPLSQIQDDNNNNNNNKVSSQHLLSTLQRNTDNCVNKTDTKHIDDDNNTTTRFLLNDSDDDILNDFSMCLDDFPESKNDIYPPTLFLPQLDGASDSPTSTKRLRPNQIKTNLLNRQMCHSPSQDNFDKIVEMLKDNKEVTVAPVAKKIKILRNAPVIDLTLSDDDQQQTDVDDDDDDDDDANDNSPTKLLPALAECSLSRIPMENMLNSDVGLYSGCINRFSSITDLSPPATPTKLPQQDRKKMDEETPPNTPETNKKIKLSPTFNYIIKKSPIVKLKKMTIDELENLADKKTTTLNNCSPLPPPAITTPPKRYPLRNRIPRLVKPISCATEKRTTTNTKDKDRKKLGSLENDLDWSSCPVAYAYDKKHNFFPKPGPSHKNYYDNIDIPGYYHPIEPESSSSSSSSSTDIVANNSSGKSPLLKLTNNYDPEEPMILNDDDELSLGNNSVMLQSFYDNYNGNVSSNNGNDDYFTTSPTSELTNLNGSKTTDSETEIGSPIIRKIQRQFRGSTSTPNDVDGQLQQQQLVQSPATAASQPRPPSHNLEEENSIVISALLRPPTFGEVLCSMPDYNIPYELTTDPFFGDIEDTAVCKEVGNTVLKIPTRTINDLDDFNSDVINNGGINSKHRSIFNKFVGQCKSKKNFTIPQIRQYLATNRDLCITSIANPPSYMDARLWFSTIYVADNNVDDDDINIIDENHEKDSPINIYRRQLTKVSTNPYKNIEANETCDISTTINCDISSNNTLLPFASQTKPQSNIKISSPKSLAADQPERNGGNSPEFIDASQIEKNHQQKNSTRQLRSRQALGHKFENIKMIPAALTTINGNDNVIEINSPPDKKIRINSPNLFTSNQLSIKNGLQPKNNGSSIIKATTNEFSPDVICLDDDMPCSQLFITTSPSIKHQTNGINKRKLLSSPINGNMVSSGIPTTGTTNSPPTKQQKQQPEMCNNKKDLVNKNQRHDRTSLVNNLNLDGRNYGSGCSADHSFGITGVSLENTFGFKMDLENFQSVNANTDFNFLTIMCIELHICTRGNLKPDPDHDEIASLFYIIQNNVPLKYPEIPCTIVGIIINETTITNTDIHSFHPFFLENKLNITYARSEHDLMWKFIGLIAKWDPDIFAGYEIEMFSWGYMFQRAAKLDINMTALLSRVPTANGGLPYGRQIIDEDETAGSGTGGGGQYDWNVIAEFDVKLSGRIFLDVWRLLRSEIALTSYTFENCIYHILHRRCPLHSFKDLTKWWKNSVTRMIVCEYWLERVNGTIELLNHLDLIGRTSEMAKLFGILFYEVLSRGSQFRVESMMLRIAKPKNIIPVSPSVHQKAHMRAPEYLPLILEPHSRLYVDNLIVLDFQSLYPSMIIAYNYCFSTCLGRVEELGPSHPFEFGASQLRISPTILKKLLARNLITVSPCGVAFVKQSVREGVLPRMLREILDTRLMVKQSMKLHKNDKVLQRVLHSRQLGLKLMANVTYGYTAANFSGRMPCVEVGDSVVSKGRETLERAIKLVEANKLWRANVVYGDTDSLFVLVPGRSRSDAFRIGNEIAEAVTQDNPYPVKLKLEKVYQPCILQTKKRYVGYMFESAEQTTPVYEAKGIETVRRDGCPAVAKMLEKTLKILFETKDVSAVKRYICRQFTKILSGKANIQDFIYAKEFRGLQGYKPGACVPALELTRKWCIQDRRAEPRRGERVPYLIINGPPGVPLIRLVRSPHEYLADQGFKLNATYYITKAIIPPLNRCLLLVGADASQWFAELPRKVVQMLTFSNADTLMTAGAGDGPKKSTISQYFSTTSCAADCGEQTQRGICTRCIQNSFRCSVILSNKISKLDRKYGQINRLCQSCCGRQSDTVCHSLDCPILFVLNATARDHKQIHYFRQLLSDNF